MTRLLSALILLTVTVAQGGQPTDERDIETLLLAIARNEQQVPLSVQRTLLRVHYANVANRHGGVLAKLRDAQGMHSLDQVRKELRRVEAYYAFARANVDVVKFENQLGRGVVSGLDILPIKNPIAAIGEKVVGKLSDPIMAGRDAIADYVTDFAISKAFTPELTEHRIRDFVNAAIVDKNGQVDLSKLPAATRYFQKTFLDNQAFSESDDKEKAEIVRAMQLRLEQVVDRQDGTLREVFQRTGHIQGDVTTAVDLIRKTRKLVEQTTEVQADAIKRVQANQNSINKGLMAIADGIQANNDLAMENNAIASENAGRLKVIMSTMYDELPTERKLAWIEADFLCLPSDVKADEKARLEHRKILEHQLAMSKEVGEYLNGGQHVLQIAQRLGLPQDVVSCASQAISVAEAANGTVANLIAGNYLGVISSVAGLLGGGPDVAELRHRELMEQFGKVHKKLDALIEGQKVILEVVAGIDQKVVQLGQIVVAQHEQVMREMLVIQGQTTFHTEMLNQLMRKDLESTKHFLTIRRLEDYGAQQAFFDQHRVAFQNSEAMVSSWTGDADPARGNWTSLDPIFFSRSHIRLNNNDKIIPALEEQLGTTSGVLAASFVDSSARRRAWSALSVPSTRVAILESKVGRLAQSPGLTSVTMPYDFMDRLLSPEAVGEFAQTAVSLSDFFFLVKRTAYPERLFTPSELDSANNFNAADFKARREKATSLLEFCLGITNAAIAQQALLCGDLILPQLAETIDGDTTRKILARNQILAQNTLMCAIRQRMFANHRSMAAYAVAVNSNDPEYFRLITERKNCPAWKFELKPVKTPTLDGKEREVNRWFVTIGNDLMIPMPSAPDVIYGTLEWMPGIATLVNRREEVISKIAEISLGKLLPPQDAVRLGLISLSTLN